MGMSRRMRCGGDCGWREWNWSTNYCRGIQKIRNRQQAGAQKCILFFNNKISPNSDLPPRTNQQRQTWNETFSQFFVVFFLRARFFSWTTELFYYYCSDDWNRRGKVSEAFCAMPPHANHAACTHLINGKHDCFYLSICSLFGEHVRRHLPIFHFFFLFFCFSIFLPSIFQF